MEGVQRRGRRNSLIDWVGTVQVTRGFASEKSRRGHLGKRANTGRCPQPPNFFFGLDGSSRRQGTEFSNPDGAAVLIYSLPQSKVSPILSPPRSLFRFFALLSS